MDTGFITRPIKKLDWRHWAYGLFSGVIGGAATGGGSFTAIALAHAVTPKINLMDLNQLAMVCIAGGLTNAFAYLKQSPLPKEEESVTTTVTASVTEKTETK